MYYSTACRTRHHVHGTSVLKAIRLFTSHEAWSRSTPIKGRTMDWSGVLESFSALHNLRLLLPSPSRHGRGLSVAARGIEVEFRSGRLGKPSVEFDLTASGIFRATRTPSQLCKAMCIGGGQRVAAAKAGIKGGGGGCPKVFRASLASGNVHPSWAPRFSAKNTKVCKSKF